MLKNTRNIEGRETQGVLGQTSEGMQWVWGESKGRQTKGILGQMSENAMGLRGIECEGIWRRANAIEWGEKQGVLQQIGKCEEF